MFYLFSYRQDCCTCVNIALPGKMDASGTLSKWPPDGSITPTTEEPGLCQDLLTKGATFLDCVNSKSTRVAFKMAEFRGSQEAKGVRSCTVNWKEMNRKGVSRDGKYAEIVQNKTICNLRLWDLAIHANRFYITYLIAKWLAHSLFQGRKFWDGSAVRLSHTHVLELVWTFYGWGKSRWSQRG